MSTYQELLRDPRWQRRRLEVFQDADFTCQMCGVKNKQLHVHHARYDKGKMPWEYEGRLLRCVCTDCHEKLEEYKQAILSLFGELSLDDMEKLIALAREMAGHPCSAKPEPRKTVTRPVREMEAMQSEVDEDVDQALKRLSEAARIPDPRRGF